MADITGANAVFTITIPTIFSIPQTLQGFAADDVFGTDPLESVETRMGVDGNLSAGFVFKELKMGVDLQADSSSNQIFDLWWAQMQAQRGTFVAQGVVILQALGTKWVLVNGFLTRYQPIPTVKKLVEPKRFEITWESVSPAVAS